MIALLLAPHNDDETLFAAYTCMTVRPHVIVCYRSWKQEALYGIAYRVRELETECAAGVLGCTWAQLPFPDTADCAAALERELREIDRRRQSVGIAGDVYAPAVEEHGHEQHNLVGSLAVAVFGDRVIPYMTYQRGMGRSPGSRPVEFTAAMNAVKREALACYRSQLETNAAPWFLDEEQREWLA